MLERSADLADRGAASAHICMFADGGSMVLGGPVEGRSVGGRPGLIACNLLDESRGLCVIAREGEGRKGGSSDGGDEVELWNWLLLVEVERW